MPDSIMNQVAHYPSDKVPAQLYTIADNYLDLYPELSASIALEILGDSKLSNNNPLRGKTNLLLGEAHYRSGHLNNSYEAFNESFRLFTTIRNNEGRIKAMNGLGKALKDMNKTTESLDILQNALEESKKLGLPKQTALSLNYMGGCYLKRGDYVKSLDLYNQSAKLHESNLDTLNFALTCRNIATVYKNLGNNSQASHYYIQSLNLFTKTQNSYEEAMTDFHLGGFWAKNNQIDSALQYYFSALKIWDSIPGRSEKGKAYSGLGLAFRNKNKFDSSNYYYQKALKVFTDVGDSSQIANTYHNLGTLHFTFEQYDDALRYYLLALKLKYITDETGTLATTFQTIGNLYSSLKNYDKSIEFLQKSHDRYQESKDLPGMALILNLMGNTSREARNFNQARQYYNASLEARQKIGDKKEIIVILSNIGLNELESGNFNISLQNYQEALKLSTEIHNKSLIIQCNNNLGNLFLQKNDLGNANFYFKRAVNDAALSNDLYYFSLCSRKIGEIALLQGKRGEAEDYLVQAMKAAEKTQHIDLRKEASFKLFSLYKLKADYKRALEYYMQFTLLSDSIKSRINHQSINKIQSSFELGEKNKQLRLVEDEVKLLEADNQLKSLKLMQQNHLRNLILIITLSTLIVAIVLFARYRSKKHFSEMLIESNNKLIKSEKELKKSNETKDKFFNIIAHDIKNSLLGIISVSRIFSREFEKLDDNDRKEFSETIYHSSNHLYKLLENLLHWARAQTGNIRFKPVTLNMQNLVNQTVELLKLTAENKKIEISCSIPDDLEIEGDYEMIMLVIRNLVSNAIKFTNPGGTIIVTGNKTDAGARISVADNGNGIEPDLQESLFKPAKSFSTAGTSGEVGTGLGLVLCNEFIQIHNGIISLESVVNKGTTFTFVLPYIHEKTSHAHRENKL